MSSLPLPASPGGAETDDSDLAGFLLSGGADDGGGGGEEGEGQAAAGLDGIDALLLAAADADDGDAVDVRHGAVVERFEVGRCGGRAAGAGATRTKKKKKERRNGTEKERVGRACSIRAWSVYVCVCVCARVCA